ncbi:MAG: aminopeptidase, partial [Candidatus Dadabacteria bacterium]|nr:aminopeptidase [Candidatus Dadabacteria bacterium]
MAKKSGSKLEDKLVMKNESHWYSVDRKTEKAVFDFCEGYKAFLGNNKTEREVAEFIIDAARKSGFRPLSEFKKLKQGDRVMIVNKGKAVCLAV